MFNQIEDAGCSEDFSMELPSIEYEPHILISQVRKSYFDYVIQLLTINYETNQKLLGNKKYLPSAIWRCGKYMEMEAAHKCMVVDLYRTNILASIKKLKHDTKKGKLNRKLFQYLRKPPENDKKVQVALDQPKSCNCTCHCNKDTIKNKSPRSPKKPEESAVNKKQKLSSEIDNTLYKIPVIIDSKQDDLQVVNRTDDYFNVPSINNNIHPVNANLAEKNTPAHRKSIECQNSEDQVMLKLQEMFGTDSYQTDDDLFEGILYDYSNNDTIPLTTQSESNCTTDQPNVAEDCRVESLDSRLALLQSSGILTDNAQSETQNTDTQIPEQVPSAKGKKSLHSKWLCEEYFQRLYLIEKLDEIGDLNRKKHLRIKTKFVDLFGDDSDDEQVMSPLDETPEFLMSCKERVAPWVVKTLTPHYVKGNIKGKALFKCLAKHLIKLVNQCSLFPSETDVNGFVTDFLKNHRLIRCEADFKDFQIANI